MDYQPNIILPEIKILEPISTEPLKHDPLMETSLPTPDLEVEDNLPLQIYDEKKRTPFVVEMFELGELYDGNADNMKEKTFYIDNWVKNRIAEKNMRANIASYKAILDDIFYTLGLSKESGYIKTNKLFKFLKFLKL